MRLDPSIIGAGLLCSLAVQALADVPLKVHAGGRVITTPGKVLGFRYQWPGTYFEARFKGPHLAVHLNDPGNIYKLYVDDKLLRTLQKPDYSGLNLDDLGPGTHTARLELLTESQEAAGRFDGFSVRDRTSALNPERRKRAMEIIGDSYAVGLADTSSKRQCTGDEIWASTDTQQSFGVLTAKHFSADYQVNAISGRGIVRNYGGTGGDLLPDVYPYALFDKAVRYADTSWHPQVLVLALGGNDFLPSTPDGAKWKSTGELAPSPGGTERWKTTDDLRAAYRDGLLRFVSDLRKHNPGAYIILLAYGVGEVYSDYGIVLSQMKAAGEARADLLAVSGLSRAGCNWHMTQDDHQKVSATLVTFLDQRRGVWDLAK